MNSLIDGGLLGPTHLHPEVVTLSVDWLVMADRSYHMRLKLKASGYRLMMAHHLPLFLSIIIELVLMPSPAAF